MQLQFRAVAEEGPGSEWTAAFRRGWPGWRDWLRARRKDDGNGDTPRLDDSLRALRRHMPEIEGMWERLVTAVGGDDEVAQFLTFWMPPRYLVSCSQLVLDGGGDPLLIRNYDLNPELNESTLLGSRWRKRRVMGMVEGMAGLADGINDAGLAASLTFGGRVQHGRGFGIPLIIRYVLEVCRDVTDACEALRAVPSHMSYNVTVADRQGRAATVMLAPDRPAMAAPDPLATNHQIGVEWPRHGRLSRTRERFDHLTRMLAAQPGHDEARRAFLAAPLFSTGYARGFGTVYTAAYRPAAGEVTLAWRRGDMIRERFDGFCPAAMQVRYSDAGSIAAPAPLAARRASIIPSRPTVQAMTTPGDRT